MLESLPAVEKPPFMTVQSLDLRHTGQFSALLLDYLDEREGLKEFYNVFPSAENTHEIIRQRLNFDAEKREILVKVLQEQYQNLPNIPDFSILLQENTFTVTTGHQLNIFTGPLYIIYKIVTTINLARKLKQAHPDYNFVPVYWMASEDHDFAEIASVNLFGQKHTWKGEHSGAVGRLDPKELESILRLIPDRPLLFSKAYLENDTLSDAVRCYMHELFGKDGLICLDADNIDLKREFLPVIRQELTTSSSAELLSATSSKLSSLGYHPQISAREINLFYLEDNVRERIVREGKDFKVLNTELRFSEDEILKLAENQPDIFSPNVVLRPLYEEIILPNLAYIGGPSEVPYWMQLKGIFDHYNVVFPMLIPRNFALYLNECQQKKAEKLKLDPEDLFLDEVALRKTFIQKNTEHKIDLEDQKLAFSEVFENIVKAAVKVDFTMEGAVKAEYTRLLNSLEKLERRIRRAEERNHESEIEQLLRLKNKLFPGGSAQERYDNFLNFYLSDNQFIQKLLSTFDPLCFRYYLLTES